MVCAYQKQYGPARLTTITLLTCKCCAHRRALRTSSTMGRTRCPVRDPCAFPQCSTHTGWLAIDLMTCKAEQYELYGLSADGARQVPYMPRSPPPSDAPHRVQHIQHACMLGMHTPIYLRATALQMLASSMHPHAYRRLALCITAGMPLAEPPMASAEGNAAHHFMILQTCSTRVSKAEPPTLYTTSLFLQNAVTR